MIALALIAYGVYHVVGQVLYDIGYLADDLDD